MFANTIQNGADVLTPQLCELVYAIGNPSDRPSDILFLAGQKVKRIDWENITYKVSI